ncbi:putative sodium-coupled neutral amino acid transporter 11 isoform X3 [Ptychodera flava]|uniref:putative sodium-coupled neutral amino acid transporter 11 isoform X3 n=1 Tax=Ptychodera flava TaxID=63121 RepID=UPI00396A23A3
MDTEGTPIQNATGSINQNATANATTADDKGVQLELMKDAAKMPTYGEFETTDDKAQLVNSEEVSKGESDDRDRSSLPGASLNTVNSIIGSGILGMPYAMNLAGLPLGIILMILVSFVTDYSMVLLIKGGELSGTGNYQDLVRAAFGKPGYVWLSAIQFLYPFIAMISYNVIIGDTITKVLMRIFHLPEEDLGTDHVLANRYFIISISTVLVTLPLSAYRNISKLVKVSIVSLFMVAFIVIVIIVRTATMGPHIPPTPGAWDFGHIHFAQAIGIMSFAFVCQHNSFLIYDSLEEPTIKNWSLVAHISVMVSFLVSALFGACGYATFKGYTQGDILENYCHDDDLANAARLIYGITIMFTFPIECFVTREVLDNIIVNWGYAEKPQTLTRHLVETLILVGLTLGISMATDCLGIVLELNGVLGAVPLVFILPSASYLKFEEGTLYSLRKLPALIICIIGVFSMIAGFIMSFIYSKSCSHGREMWYCQGNTSLPIHHVFDNQSLDYGYTTEEIYNLADFVTSPLP